MVTRIIRKAFPLVSRLHKELCGIKKTPVGTIEGFRRGVASISFTRNRVTDELMKPKYDFQEVSLSEVRQEEKKIKLTFQNGTEGVALHVWLRDNCQCSDCFDKEALARRSLLIDLDINIAPVGLEHNEETLKVTWSDGHVSLFDAQWLFERAFIPKAMESYRHFYKIEKAVARETTALQTQSWATNLIIGELVLTNVFYFKEPWGKEVVLDRFDFTQLLEDEQHMLEWLITLERKGITIIKTSSNDLEAGPKLINKIGYVKGTHFGLRSPVKTRAHVQHLAYRTMPLGLHNDLPYYNYAPGIVFLNTIQKHEGEGGGSLLSDGLLGVKTFKERTPDKFKVLCDTGIYFWDKGIGVTHLEKKQFHKINKSPVIELDSDGEFHILRMSTWGRDSHMFLPHDVMYSFYDALTSLNKIIYQNHIKYKMDAGEMLVLDNYRVLHGREGYSPESSRHLETSYMDWDEAQCTRRLKCFPLRSRGTPKQCSRDTVWKALPYRNKGTE